MQKMADGNTPHVAIIPSPGIGHLIPLVELAKRLLDNHGFTVSMSGHTSLTVQFGKGGIF